MKNQKLAYLYIGIVIFLWSTVAAAFKVSLKYLSVLQLLFIASLTSAFVLFVILIFENKVKNLFTGGKKAILYSFITALLNPFLYYLVLFTAYDLLPAQVAQPLNYTWPLVLVILSGIFLKQKIPLLNYIAIAVSFIGAAIVASYGNLSAFHSLNITGVFLALLSALIWGTFWIANLKDKREEAVKLCLNFIIGTVFIFFLGLTKNVFTSVDVRGVAPAIYVGLFEMGITYLLFLKALALSKTTAKVGILVYLAPFLSLIFIRIIVKEETMLSTFIGLLLIVLGIVIDSSYRRRMA